MPHINLIYEQRAAVRRKEAQARSGLMLFALSLGLTAVGSGFLLLQSQFSRSEEDRLKAELDRLAPMAKEIEKNNSVASEFAPRVKSLTEAKNSTDRWHRILTHLTVNTPKDTWLTTLRSNADDPAKPVLVTVTGMGTAQSPIGELLLRAQNSHDLENVQLGYTEERVINQKKAISFEFGANVTGTQPDGASDPKGGS